MQSFLDKPSVIPIELIDERTWIHRFSRPFSVVIPYYSVWLNREARAKMNRQDIHKTIGFNGPIGLSSIGPDECVTNEAFLVDFMQFSMEHDFDYVIAWDEPTYIDWPSDRSWKYTTNGLENVRRMLKQGLRVIGLINGSNRTHFDKCTDSLLSMGIDSVATHVSDYLRNRRDSQFDFLLRDLMQVVTSKFKKVLVIGATDPYFAKYELKPKFPKVSVAGLSWYLDAVRGIVYGHSGRVDINQTDVVCDCQCCRNMRLQELSTSFQSRSIHNFLAVKSVVEGRDPPKVERFGIVHRGQKMMIVGDLYLGTEESLLYDFLDALKAEKPKTLILLGNTFDLEKAEPDVLHLHAEEFLNLLIDRGIEVYPVYGKQDSSLAAISNYIKRFSYRYDSHPNIHFSRYMETDPAGHLLRIYKFYAVARDSITIKLKSGKVMYCAHGPLWPGLFPTSASFLEGLSSDIMERMLKVNKCDCIVLAGYHTEIMQEGKLYSLASWQRRTPEQVEQMLEPDLRGGLVIWEDMFEYKKY